MSSSPEVVRPVAAVLRGTAAASATAARLDGDLRSHRYLRADFDPRLLDPTLETAFSAATQQARANAEAEGYAAGYAAGRTAANVDVAAEAAVASARADAVLAQRLAALDQAVTALTTAASSVERRAVATYAEAADHLGPAAYALVEALLGHELETRPETVLDAVRRAASAAPAEGALTVHLNPADAAALLDARPELDAVAGRPVEVRADASVAPGDARAAHGATRVDASLAGALARVREVLAP